MTVLQRLSDRLPQTLPGLARLGAVSLVLLVLASIRHHFVWGEPYERVLHVVEWTGLIVSQAGLGLCLLRGLRILDDQGFPLGDCGGCG